MGLPRRPWRGLPKPPWMGLPKPLGGTTQAPKQKRPCPRPSSFAQPGARAPEQRFLSDQLVRRERYRTTSPVPSRTLPPPRSSTRSMPVNGNDALAGVQSCGLYAWQVELAIAALGTLNKRSSPTMTGAIRFIALPRICIADQPRGCPASFGNSQQDRTRPSGKNQISVARSVRSRTWPDEPARR